MIASDLIIIMVPLVAVIMLMALSSIKAPVKFGTRSAIIGLTIAGLLSVFISFNMLLSQPRPASFEWVHRNVKEVEVVSSIIENKKAIYVWILFPEETKPRYYVFDWDQKMAERLQKVTRQQKRGAERGTVILKDPFLRTEKALQYENNIQFVPIPRQLPLKDHEK